MRQSLLAKETKMEATPTQEVKVTVNSALLAWRQKPNQDNWLVVLEAAEANPNYIVSGTNLFYIQSRPYRGRGWMHQGDWMVRVQRFNRKHKHWNSAAYAVVCPERNLPKPKQSV
jgi:hypothetical protein